MKDLRLALFDFLRDDAAIGAVVTAGGTTRIYPQVLPQGVKQPSVVYTRVSGQGDYTMQGATGYARVRVQLDAWAPKADAAADLANLVKARIDGYSGMMGDVVVQGVFMADQREGYDDTAQMFRIGRDYFIHHEEL